MSFAAGNEFPAALSTVRGWLRPIEYTSTIMQLLHESGLSERFPEDALHFLDAVLDNQTWVPRELGQCLTAIAEAKPALKQDNRYQRLEEYSRQHGN